MRVTFLTVGEYPSSSGLHASQVLPFVAYLRERGVSVNWIAYVPVEMLLRDLVANRGATLTKMKRLTTEQGIDFTVSLFPISMTRVYSYALRNWLVRRAGSKFARLIETWTNGGELHIIHCRSYFATAVALEARKKHNHIRVSFDMRSLLPPEIPLMFPIAGKYLYGGLKRWETDLLKQSDFSFLPSKRGICRLELEGLPYLPMYIPIAGFENGPGSPQEGEEVHSAVIGYVGGIGPWHSATLLERVFEELARFLPSCSFEVLTTNPRSFRRAVKVRTLSNEEIEKAVGAMMAVVVPGTEACEEYFMQNVSAYLFSTKAAEALSLGVPLIVNAKVKELADYVRAKGCGLVFSLVRGHLRFEELGAQQLGSTELWHRLRVAASNCSNEFRRSTVFEKYLAAWNDGIRQLPSDCGRSNSD